MCLLFWGKSHLVIFSFSIVLAYLVSYAMCSNPQEIEGIQEFSSSVLLTGQCPFKATLEITIKRVEMGLYFYAAALLVKM